MIESMSLQNFKGWAELPETRFGKLTGFFGPNSAGKSSLIQLLLMLKQTVESPDRSIALNLGEETERLGLVQLGTFEELVHKHDLQQAFKFTLHWSPRESIKIRPFGTSKKIIETITSLILDVTIHANKSTEMVVDEVTYRWGQKSVALVRGETRYDLKVDKDSVGLKFASGRKWEFPRPTKFYGFPDRVRTDFENPDLFLDLERSVESFFAQELFYLGPLRSQPIRLYTWAGSRPEDVGLQGEKTVMALLASRADGKSLSRGFKKRKETLQERIAKWLVELKLVHDFRLTELAEGTNRYKVEVQTTKEGSWVVLPDVGFGVSQVLPVLTLCYYAPEGSTIILEHPEIHLHPSVQAGLADALLDAIKTRNVQIIVESHSEHFVRRLQRRVAEGKVDAKEVALYFCDRSATGSTIEPLRLNIFGEIENWPIDFFGDQLGEIIQIQEAGLKRKVHNPKP